MVVGGAIETVGSLILIHNVLVTTPQEVQLGNPELVLAKEGSGAIKADVHDAHGPLQLAIPASLYTGGCHTLSDNVALNSVRPTGRLRTAANAGKNERHWRLAHPADRKSV